MCPQQILRHTIHKRSFLLFEILLSCSLVILCLLPLIKPHLTIQSQEKAYLRNIQIEQETERALTALKEILYTHKEYTWKQLRQGICGELPIEAHFYLDKNPIKSTQCTYEIKSALPLTQKEALVLETSISFVFSKNTLSAPTRFIYVQKKTLLNSSDESDESAEEDIP